MAPLKDCESSVGSFAGEIKILECMTYTSEYRHILIGPLIASFVLQMEMTGICVLHGFRIVIFQFVLTVLFVLLWLLLLGIFKFRPIFIRAFLECQLNNSLWLDQVLCHVFRCFMEFYKEF